MDIELCNSLVDIMNDPEALEEWHKNAQEEENFTFKSVNYLAIIPVLTKAIQEQQEAIEAEQARNEELENTLNDLQAQMANLQATDGSTQNSSFDVIRDLEANFLFQNVPNPFNSSTEIRYQVKEGFRTAAIYVFDMQGKQLKTFENLNQGEGSVWVSANELDAGMYLYSLVVDGKEVATQRMILTK